MARRSSPLERCTGSVLLAILFAVSCVRAEDEAPAISQTTAMVSELSYDFNRAIARLLEYSPISLLR